MGIPGVSHSFHSVVLEVDPFRESVRPPGSADIITVAAIAFAAHRRDDAVSLQEPLIIVRAILAAAIGMMDQA